MSGTAPAHDDPAAQLAEDWRPSWTTRPACVSALGAAGAVVIADPTVTPWNSLNSRLEAPAGLQLTLFTELGTPSDRKGRPQTSTL